MAICLKEIHTKSALVIEVTETMKRHIEIFCPYIKKGYTGKATVTENILVNRF